MQGGRAAVRVRPPQRSHHARDHRSARRARCARGQPRPPARGRRARLCDRPRAVGGRRDAGAMARAPLPRVYADHRATSARRAAPRGRGIDGGSRCARRGAGAHADPVRRAVRDGGAVQRCPRSRGCRTTAPPACCSTSASGIRRITPRRRAVGGLAGHEPGEDSRRTPPSSDLPRVTASTSSTAPGAPTRSSRGCAREWRGVPGRGRRAAFRTATRRPSRTRRTPSRIRCSPRTTIACGWSPAERSGIRGAVGGLALRADAATQSRRLNAAALRRQRGSAATARSRRGPGR